MGKVKVTLVKSVIATPPNHRKIVRSMGLRKTGRSRVFEDNPSIRGKIFHVKHLVEVEEVK